MIDVSREYVAEMIGENLSLTHTDFGSSIEVEYKDQSIKDAADVVCNYFADQQEEQGVADSGAVIAKLRQKQHELAGSAQILIKSSFTGDWLAAVKKQAVADEIKNVLAEVGL